MQENKNLQNELCSYMERLSELKIHTENIEMELGKKILNLEEKATSNALIIQEKENQINTLKNQYNELNAEFQNKLEAELNQMKMLEIDDETFKSNEEISSLKDEIETLKV